MRQFQHAIVRRPCRAMVDGITSAPELGKPIYELALEQHDAYIRALEQCGIEVSILDADEAFPDSCFMKMWPCCPRSVRWLPTPEHRPAMEEKRLIIDEIRKYYDEAAIHCIQTPGTLDGGDVMMVGDCFYVGESERTNTEGIRQFGSILAAYGYSCIAVPMEKMLHLKTGVNYLENNNLLAAGEFAQNPLLTDSRKCWFQKRKPMRRIVYGLTIP